MNLLIFAHRNEAKSFLKEKNLSPYSFIFQGVYRSCENFILITGEGMENASYKTASLLGHLLKNEKISQIINLGVAGSLDSQCVVGEIYAVRTSYAYRGKEMAFKSFSSEQNLSSNFYRDCVSSDKRILDSLSAENLSHFAPLVDRELWGIASIAKLFSIPFSSFKIVSDLAGDKEICQVVKDQASILSEKLFHFYQSVFLARQISHFPKVDQTSPILEGFHFSESMSRKFKTLMKKFEYLDFKLEDISISSIIESEKSPKKRAKKLIDELNQKVSPFESKIKELINEELKDTEGTPLKVSFDENFETESLFLQAKIQNMRDMQKVIWAIKNLNIEKIQKILNGDLDV